MVLMVKGRTLVGGKMTGLRMEAEAAMEMEAATNDDAKLTKSRKNQQKVGNV